MTSNECDESMTPIDESDLTISIPKLQFTRAFNQRVTSVINERCVCRFVHDRTTNKDFMPRRGSANNWFNIG
jgi:hypothetical protein